MRLFKIVLFLIGFLAPASWAAAHPHIFIRAAATMQFENGKVTGILHEWTFDDFFSSALIADFDKNKNKQFDPDEVAELAKNAFAALKEYGYFTHMRVNGKEIAITATRDFAPAIKDGKVVYRFVAVLPEPLDPRTDKIDASIYDESYYVDVDVNDKGGVKLAGTGAEGCKYAMFEDKASPLYFGSIFARRIEITCAK